MKRSQQLPWWLILFIIAGIVVLYFGCTGINTK